MDELKNLVEVAARSASRVFKGQGGKMNPMWHIVMADGKEVIMPHPPLGKDEAAALMREILKSLNVVRYCWIAESWLATATNEAEKAELDKAIAATGCNSIAEYAGRQEALTFMAEDRTRQILAHRMITRNAKGRPTLGPLTFMPEWERGLNTGRMVGMMLPEGRMQ